MLLELLLLLLPMIVLPTMPNCDGLRIVNAAEAEAEDDDEVK